MHVKLNEISRRVGDVVRRYPMVLASALLAAISMMCYANQHPGITEQPFVFLRFAIVCALGIPLFFALYMLGQRVGRGTLMQAAGALFLFGFYYLLPDTEKAFTELYAYLLVPVFLLSHLLVSFVAFVGNNREDSFWQYNKNLLINTFLAAFFTVVLTGGTLLAIVATDQLFELKINNNWYSYTLFFMLFFASTFIFLLFNSGGLRALEQKGNYPVVLKFFVQYILIPLLLLYVVILYAYSTRILLRWELPRGWVSYLILIYSVVGILALLLVHPLRHETSKSWVKIFSKVFYYTLPPLVVLLFVAIFTRILEYGYTEPRYFVLVLALWITSVAVYTFASKRPTVKFIPMSLFFFGLCALALPYFNAFSVAKRSQARELLNVLQSQKLLEEDKINFNKKISARVTNDVSDKFNFLAMRGEQNYLNSLLDQKTSVRLEKLTAEHDFSGVRNLITASFRNTTQDAEAAPVYTILVADDVQYSISSYDYLLKAYSGRQNIFKFDQNSFEIHLPDGGSSSAFYLKMNGQQINLTSDLEQLFQQTIITGEVRRSDLKIVKYMHGFEIVILPGTVHRTVDRKRSRTFIMDGEPVLILIRKAD